MPIGTIAVAVSLVVAACSAPTTVSPPTPTPATVAATPSTSRATPEPSPSPTSGAPTGWVRHPDHGPTIALGAIAAGGPGFVAVGGGIADDDATIATSRDGLDWTLIENLPDAHRAPIADVAAGPAGLVAVGPDFSAVPAAGGSLAAACEVGNGYLLPAFWVSADGTTWARARTSDPRAFPAMAAVTRGDDRFVAVGGDVDSAAWTSADGASWERGSNQALAGVTMTDVAFHAGRFTAVGSKGCEAIGDEATVVATSPDGATWKVVEGATFPGRRSAKVAAGPAGIVVFGDVGAWSIDGIAWTRMTSLTFQPEAVAALPNGFVAVGQGGAWGSRDGRSWLSLTGAEGAGDYLLAVAVGPTSVVALGAGGSVVWTGPASVP
jgi:hypothetical protein